MPVARRRPARPGGGAPGARSRRGRRGRRRSSGRSDADPSASATAASARTLHPMPLSEPPWLPPEPPIGPVVRPPEHWRPIPVVAPEPRTRRPWAAVVVGLIGVIIGAITPFAPWANYID